MEGKEEHPATIDEYIAQVPEDVQQILTRIRTVIKEAAPEAVEKISYNMPAFFQNDGLVWFGAWKKHIAVYPRVSGNDEALNQRLAAYHGTKGSFHFPLDKPIPYDLIGEIVRLRLAETAKLSE